MQVLDFRSLHEVESRRNGKIFGRLTKFGVVRIAIALLTLVFIAVNEYLSYIDQINTSTANKEIQESLSKSINDTKEKLEASNEYINELTREIAKLQSTSAALSQALDASLIRKERAIVRTEDFGGQVTYLLNDRGQKVSPKKGDDIEWNIACFAGVPPALPANGSCDLAGFGRVIAFSYPVNFDRSFGKKTLVGTASNDAEMVYQSPVFLGCREIAQQLQDRSCELQMTFWREARYEVLEHLEKIDGSQLDLSPPALAACRRYAALYGESCEEALNRIVDQPY